jgi:hypothetical protein
MTTYVELLENPDTARHKKMVKAVNALRAADIWEMPKELEDYFNCIETGEVDDDGHKLIKRYNLNYDHDKKTMLGVKIFSINEKTGVEIDLKKLPQDVNVIKLYNSY